MTAPQTYQTEMKPVLVHARCDECKEGELLLVKGAEVRTSYPPQYKHKCDKCQAETWLTGQTYPHIEYIEIPQGGELTAGTIDVGGVNHINVSTLSAIT